MSPFLSHSSVFDHITFLHHIVVSLSCCVTISHTEKLSPFRNKSFKITDDFTMDCMVLHVTENIYRIMM